MERDTGSMRHTTDERIVKFPLPITLIREIDHAIVSGLGGYSTRTEFFRDAAEGLLVELKYEHAPPEPAVRVPGEAESGPDESHSHREGGPGAFASPVIPEPMAQSSLVKPDSLAATALRLAADGVPITGGDAEIDDEPLFGMHNRDFPSLWVAFRLASRSAAGLVPYTEFVDEVTEEAWEYARVLRQLEAQANQKLTALFPTNLAKPQSAADAFRTFAVGTITNGKESRLRADGPLFAWRICQVKRAFLHHLQRYSRGDWWGFRTVLGAAAEQPTRPELVEAFQSARPDWRPNVAATNAQGYLARAREWGLIQPKQFSGRYALTDFGRAYIAEAATNGSSTSHE
jgi:hypothetical protein